MPSSAPISENPSISSTARWLALAGIAMGVFMSTLDMSIVNISLPTLVEDLNTDLATVEWVILSYSLVATTLLLSVSRLGDMRNKKKLYMFGISIFILGSALCGTATNVNQLIGFRAVQGFGATFLQALGLAIVTTIFPANMRGRALGIAGTAVSAGVAFGPPLGGLLIGLAGWRSIFWVNIPVGLLALLTVWRFIPNIPPRQRNQQFDLPGAFILLITLGCYALGMTYGQSTGFANNTVLVLLGTALIGLVIFLNVERRTPQPMVDLSLFRNRLFSINLVMGFLVFFTLAGNFILPFFLNLVEGYSTPQIGLMLMAQPVAMGLVAPFSGALSDRFGSRWISIIGLLLVTGGCLALSTMHAGMTPLGFVLRVIPLGLGMGTFNSPNNSAIMGVVPRERLGVASGLLALTRNMGQTSGLPMMGALFTAAVVAFGGVLTNNDVTIAAPEALIAGVNITYRIAAAAIFVATVLAVVALRMDRMARKASSRAASQPGLPTE